MAQYIRPGQEAETSGCTPTESPQAKNSSTQRELWDKPLSRLGSAPLASASQKALRSSVLRPPSPIRGRKLSASSAEAVEDAMSKGSRIPGFYKLGLDERRQQVAEHSDLTVDELEIALRSGGIDPQVADKVVENVLGVYSLPFGVALNFTINGTDRLVPMVVEEPSVIAAASNAARMIRSAGGCSAELLDDLMTT